MVFGQQFEIPFENPENNLDVKKLSKEAQAIIQKLEGMTHSRKESFEDDAYVLDYSEHFSDIQDDIAKEYPHQKYYDRNSVPINQINQGYQDYGPIAKRVSGPDHASLSNEKRTVYWYTLMTPQELYDWRKDQTSGSIE